MRLFPFLRPLCIAGAGLLVACGAVPRPDSASAGQPPITATPGAAATAKAAPASRGIPNGAQSLRFSGAASGPVTSAEVRACGARGDLWLIQLSNLSLNGASASLSLTVPSYRGPSTYQPQGSLMLIVNQRASFFPYSSGSVTIVDPQKGSMDATFASGGSSVRVAGGWAC